MKLWHMYRRDFPDIERVGRIRFEATVHRHVLKVRNRMLKPRITDSRHGLPLFPSLVRSFIPTAINQLWVSDITYVPTWVEDSTHEFAYPSLIMDAYRNEIIGWAVGRTLKAPYPAKALEMALGRFDGAEG